MDTQVCRLVSLNGATLRGMKCQQWYISEHDELRALTSIEPVDYLAIYPTVSRSSQVFQRIAFPSPLTSRVTTPS